MKPYAQIVCWSCKRRHGLRRLLDEDGKKSDDYACEKCLTYGRPPIGNSSRIYFRNKNEEK